MTGVQTCALPIWSAEEEHRQLLRAALRSDGLIDRLRAMPDAGADRDFDRARELPRDVEL